MKWTNKKITSLFLIGMLMCTMYSKLYSPISVVNRAEDAVVVLQIVKKVVVNPEPESWPPTKTSKHKTINVQLIKKNQTFLCAGYVADSYGHIVTAAHCVVGGKDVVSVTVYLHNNPT